MKQTLEKTYLGVIKRRHFCDQFRNSFDSLLKFSNHINHTSFHNISFHHDSKPARINTKENIREWTLKGIQMFEINMT